MGESDYLKFISDALETSKTLVVIGTGVEHLNSHWVEYEYTTFLILMLNGDKPGGNILSYLMSIKPKDLPTVIKKFQSVIHSVDDDGKSSIEELYNFIKKSKKNSFKNKSDFDEIKKETKKIFDKFEIEKSELKNQKYLQVPKSIETNDFDDIPKDIESVKKIYLNSFNYYKSLCCDFAEKQIKKIKNNVKWILPPFFILLLIGFVIIIYTVARLILFNDNKEISFYNFIAGIISIASSIFYDNKRKENENEKVKWENNLKKVNTTYDLNLLINSIKEWSSI